MESTEDSDEDNTTVDETALRKELRTGQENIEDGVDTGINVLIALKLQSEKVVL